MKVLCEGYDRCEELKDSTCSHSKPHDKYALCSGICCDDLPYSCTNIAYEKYHRKDKLERLKKINENK